MWRDTQEVFQSSKFLNKGGIIFSLLGQPNSDLMNEFDVCGIRQDVNRRDRLLL